MIFSFKGAVNESVDDGSFSDRLISEENELEFSRRSDRLVLIHWCVFIRPVSNLGIYEFC